MAINNQPTIEPRTVTGIFTKYMAKTLPLAFDESMSYYECLCALLEYINEDIVPDINNVNDGLEELQGFYADLQNYVNEYFDNLDVQEEINNKLDEMTRDGSLTNLIKNYVDPIYQEYETSINNTVSQMEEQIELIDNKVESATSGSPAGVYETVSDLTTDDPDHDKIYVVEANGEWYYYNTSTSQWTSGGEYQSPSYADTIDQLKTDISEISTTYYPFNLFNPVTATLNSAIDTSNGNILSNWNDWYVSDYMEIEPNSKYLATQTSTATSWGRAVVYSHRYNFYDENKTYISSGTIIYRTANPVQLLETPATAKYVRVSTQPGGSDLQTLTAKQIMFFKTTTATCPVDEKIPFEETYPSYKRVDTDNLSDELQDTISQVINTNTVNILNLQKIKNKFRYIIPTFKGTRADGMILLGTNDLKVFDLISEQGVYTARTESSVRDPSVIKIGDYFYLVYTTAGFSSGDRAGFCRTKDFVNYEELDSLAVKDSTDTSKTFYQVWAPAWFRDIDNKLYLLSACRELQGGTFHMIINEYHPETHTLSPGHVTNIPYIDGHVYYENGKYYMAVGGARLFKSNTLLGTWTQITNTNLNNGYYEADFAIKLDSGKWRLYMQQLAATFGTAHMVYCEADSFESVWSDVQLVEYTDAALDYVRELDPSTSDEYYHWTVYDFMELNNNNNNFIS